MNKIKKKNCSPEEMNVLIDRFVQEVVPVAVENHYTLHELFSYCRMCDTVKNRVLCDLWRTYFGEAYLKSAFRGGHLTKKYLKSIGL